MSVFLRSAAATALLGLLGTPSVAVAEQKQTNPEARVCKETTRTGTRFTTRVCRTAEEWEKLSERHKRDGKDLIDRASAAAQIKQHGEL